MEDKNRLINRFFARGRSFDREFQLYKRLNEEIKECDDFIENFKVNLEESKNDEDLSLKDKNDLFEIMYTLIYQSKDGYFKHIDLENLLVKLKKEFPEIQTSIDTKAELEDLKDQRHKILYEDVRLIGLKSHECDQRCLDRHTLVRIGDELKCLCCGATTNDYRLTKEEVDFLSDAANTQDQLLLGITKEDLPLVNVLLEQQAYQRSKREPYDIDDEDFLSKSEERYLDEMSEIPNIETNVERAHMLDEEKYEQQDLYVKNPRYFSEEKTKKLLDQIDKELREAFSKKVNRRCGEDARWLNLRIEMCRTARWEVLILSGRPLPKLIEQAMTREDKIALTKAYYNLSTGVNQMDYFASYIDRASYTCLTTDQAINKRILKMKVRQKQELMK